jgi:cellulose synthase/poly-beta-1,6-N-acetylglucosamine synthase-like glycosyltransferase
VSLFVFVVAVSLTAWVYAGYPALLALVGKFRPRPRRREEGRSRLSVIVAAYNEADVIAQKIADVRESDYPSELIEIVVASNGSTDDTVAVARRAGADIVLELPVAGKMPALVAAVEASTGELLVFTDADATFERDTLRQLVANFADPEVGGVSANDLVGARSADGAVVRGESLYWRYDQWIKRHEDAIGSTVSACGGLYAIRRSLFRKPKLDAGTDDFLISVGVVRAGHRLAFDEHTYVRTVVENDGRSEFRRKVRVMNRGQRAAFASGRLIVPLVGGFYAIQLLSHQVLRRFVPFFLVAALVASAVLAARDARWWLVLAPQLAFYALAFVGWAVQGQPWGRTKVLWVPYYFCLANLAAAIAMLSLATGVRYRSWEPIR